MKRTRTGVRPRRYGYCPTSCKWWLTISRLLLLWTWPMQILHGHRIVSWPFLSLTISSRASTLASRALIRVGSFMGNRICWSMDVPSRNGQLQILTASSDRPTRWNPRVRSSVGSTSKTETYEVHLHTAPPQISCTTSPGVKRIASRTDKLMKLANEKNTNFLNAVYVTIHPQYAIQKKKIKKQKIRE